MSSPADKHFQAVILDMDGVLTQTAAQHARAWKEMFDRYNDRRREEGDAAFTPFSLEEDYPVYIDGMPRYDGVRRFLESRGISLPKGSSEDEPGTPTICGLGNWKNQLFQAIIEAEGVQVFPDNVEQVRGWRAAGLKTGVISASKNCRRVLRSAGIEDLFEVRIDGEVAEERGLAGKPAPDVFLEAARELAVEPGAAVVVEDAQAGVKAGKAGGFGLVVGLLNNAASAALYENGADLVVENLKQLNIAQQNEMNRKTDQLPSALKSFEAIVKALEHKKLLLLLDFDGTLAPIVPHHNDAAITDSLRALIRLLAEESTTAVVSGRGMDDVRRRVNVDGIYYAGSHGFEISGPGGFASEQEDARQRLPALRRLEKQLRQELHDISGVRFENKKFSLAIHYRQVADEQQQEVIDRVEATIDDFPELKKGEGKKVIEVQPAVDWHKGKAVQLLIDELSARGDHYYPLYIGDDITDENAFRVLRHREGMGILVGDHGRSTQAEYRLEDVDEVASFLKRLHEYLTEKQHE